MARVKTATMESIKTASYQIHFKQAAFQSLQAHLEEAGYSSVFVLVDENTKKLCLPPFLRQMKGFPRYSLLEIHSGEEHKNIDSCMQVWQAMSDLDADRKSVLINLGGGVLTDLGGFVASTFKRGIDFINIPTTLLAMVDASIGGKTGVDLGPLKNQIGVINQPQMVLIITDFLQTLDPRQLQSGFAEMLKHGLIRSESYWNALKNLESAKEAAPFIYDSVQIKNEVVLEDPRENHLRKILNFGHTLGHAIESHFLAKKGKDALLHGEAIAVGMVLEAYLSHKLCNLDLAVVEEIKTTFLSHYPKVEFSDRDIEQILDLLKFDKKNTHGRINFVLLAGIGDTAIDVTVPGELYEEAFAYYKD